MSDRDRLELELAAKAAGLPIVGDADTAVAFPGNKSGGLVVRNQRGGDSLWNPITDDGDALRLAVALKFTVGEHLGARHAGVRPCPDDYEDGKYPVRISQIDGSDPYAATRRAIVRAAAEIGKALP